MTEPPRILTLLNTSDAFHFYRNQRVVMPKYLPWWRRLGRWVARVVLRRKPEPPVRFIVTAVDRETGTVTMEAL